MNQCFFDSNLTATLVGNKNSISKQNMDILTSNKRPAEDERYEGFYPKLQKRRHYEYTVDHDEIEAESEKRYPGDKSYKSPEYSEQFHKKGTIRPIVTFGSNFKPPVVTTAHLVKQLPNVTPDSNLSVTMSKKIRQAEEAGNTQQKERLLRAEQNEVVRLDDWKPDDPLKPPNFEQVSRRYGWFFKNVIFDEYNWSYWDIFGKKSKFSKFVSRPERKRPQLPRPQMTLSQNTTS